MTGVSVCSFETKSTVDMKSTYSTTTKEEEETISLPENIKALLGDARRRSAASTVQKTEEEKASSNVDASLSSLDETVRRDILQSVTAAVKEWDEAEKKRNKNCIMNASQSSKPIQRKVGLLEAFGHSGIASKSRSGSFDGQRPVASADESSEYVCKPQPHDDDESGFYAQNMTRRKHPEEELSAVLRKYQLPRKASKHAWAKEQAQVASNLFLRMSRQVKYGRRGSLPNPHRRNRIKLHVYDLIPTETVMQLPWGCMIPIGKCFDVVNSSLHSMGTGAYHVGVEVNGTEYSFGACEIPGHTGVFSCVPKRSPGYQYRTTIDFGERALLKTTWVNAAGTSEGELDSLAPAYRSAERYVDGREVIKQMAVEYMGIDYDLLRKNCVTFASDACVRLGVKEEEIPSWFRNLCESGAITQDVALQTVEPIQSIFSACEDYGDFAEKTIEDGFEVITQVDGHGLQTVVMVMDAVESNQFYTCNDCPTIRKTLSWTY